MRAILPKDTTTYFSLLCALLLFIGVMPLPIEYYSLLRIVVFVGALLVISSDIKKFQKILVFTLIAILFNPLFPIYLHDKDIWIPIDIVCGTLFLLNLLKKNKSKSVHMESEDKIPPRKRYSRDKTI
jgi:hypothetical protein